MLSHFVHHKHKSTPSNHEFREASWPVAGHSSPTPYGSRKPAQMKKQRPRTHETVVEMADLS